MTSSFVLLGTYRYPTSCYGKLEVSWVSALFIGQRGNVRKPERTRTLTPGSCPKEARVPSSQQIARAIPTYPHAFCRSSSRGARPARGSTVSCVLGTSQMRAQRRFWVGRVDAPQAPLLIRRRSRHGPPSQGASWARASVALVARVGHLAYPSAAASWSQPWRGRGL